jgi:hypothetical protein
MNKSIFYTLLIVAFGGLCYYFGLPTLNFGFYGLPFIILLISGFLYFLEFTRKKNGRNKRINPIIISIFWVALTFIILIPALSSWAIFKHEKYKDLIGEVKTGEDFANHVAPISTEEIRIVDKSMAYRLGDKVIGSIPSLGSQVNVGDFSIQKVNDKLYWVAPLLHSGYFKWQKNKQGTPGYIMVSATNERDVKLVQQVDGKPIRIKYQTEAYFGDNLQRQIYFNGYKTKGFTDFTFEVDDNGKPFWVVTLYKKRVGFSGKDAIGVLVVDVESGNMKEYSISDAPKWIDRIQPAEFISDQLFDWGEYVKGYWNFANENKLKPTKGISLIYGSNNKSYWYTGLTSVGSDEGTVGFILIDTRTKEAVWYKQTGATEIAAMSSAMGKVQEKRYVSSFPITYNINGIPTYVMSLKDNAGLIKMIAMVSVENYTIVGVGNNMKETIRSYKNALNSKGNAISPSSIMKSYTIETIVSRISSDIRNGNTFYYLLLNGYENKIFIGSSLISNELPITQSGDSVKIKYDDGANELVDIITFENLNFKLQKSEQQRQIEKYFNK